MSKSNKCHCKCCGHEWESRTVKPLACPRCKRYDWSEIKQESKGEKANPQN